MRILCRWMYSSLMKARYMSVTSVSTQSIAPVFCLKPNMLCGRVERFSIQWVSLELRIVSTIFRTQYMKAIGLYWPISFLVISETLTWSHWGGILPLSQSLFKIFKRIRMTWLVHLCYVSTGLYHPYFICTVSTLRDWPGERVKCSPSPFEI